MPRDRDVDIEELADTDSRRFEVEPPDGESPFVGLLRAELRQIERKARLTARQAQVFDWRLVHGLSYREIGRMIGISESMVRKHLVVAFAKAGHCRHVGVLTVLVETFGWEAVRAALSERG